MMIDSHSSDQAVNFIRQGDGAPVILVHGVAASVFDWVDLLPALVGAGYATYALDLLGHGKSVKPKDLKEYNIDRIFEHFEAWIRSLKLDSPLILDGQTIVPKGGEVTLKLTKVTTAGNIKGASEVNLQLDRLYVNRKAYTVTSNTFQSVGSSEGKKTAKQTGIGAGIGAVIGAIAGGGKGAAIGAGVGGGAGAATAAVTKGEQVRIASEEKLDFRLEEPLTVTVPIPGRSAQ